MGNQIPWLGGQDSRRRLIAWTIALAIWLLLAAVESRPAQAVLPDAPEVKSTIEKGLAFLESHNETRLGGQCLIALAFLKNGRDLKHKQVQTAIEQCRSANPADQAIDNYSLGCAIVFLCEADPQGQKQTIARYVDALLKRQQSAGGWGYPNSDRGDNSQTQYAVQGIWMAHRHGFEVPIQAIERVANYLIRVQDPSGGWGYQAIDPGSFNRVAQDGVTQSRTAAGLGSLYILGDLVQMPGRAQQEQKKSELPPALVAVQKEEPVTGRRRAAIDPAMYRRAIAEGNAWFDKNFTLPASDWNHYFIYGYERYWSYRELFEMEFPQEPDWYTAGFNYLQKSQQANGSWIENSPDSGAIHTAFGVLFLSRSSRKAINQTVVDLGQGVLRGGMGLPANTADIRELNGRLVETPLSGSVDELLALVEDEDNPELANLAASTQAIRLDREIGQRSGQLARLRALVRAESADARLVAVRSLGTTRQLDQVPQLLYALSDPDVRVVLEADKWLRFISRKVDGVGLGPGPTRNEIEQAQKAWTEWFLSIRPDGELLE